MNLLPVVLSLVGFLLTIGIVVMIHEGGHYLAAKWLGFAVKRFSIGMGKVLWRKRAWDTEFAVSLLPIGGYVAFEDDELKDDEPDRPRAKGMLFDGAPRWKKAIVVAAGPFMNFVLAVALFSVSGAIGVRDVAPLVAAAADSQASREGIQFMDRVTAVEGRRIGGIMELNSALLERAGERDVAIEFERKGEKFVRHFDLEGVTIDDAAKTKGFVFPKIGLQLAGHGVLLLSVDPKGPAAAAGLKNMDIVTQVNGERADMATFAGIIRSHPGKPVALTVEREAGKETLQLTLLPRSFTDPDTGAVSGRADIRFGAGIEFVTVRLSPWASVVTAFDKVVGLTRFQANAVGGMAKGEVSAENLSGPVGIAGMAGSALTAGVSAFLEFVALISIAIGFMNLIPIPALDGGQLVILGLEGVLRKNFSRGLKEKLGVASMALLLALALYVTMNDIGRLSG